MLNKLHSFIQNACAYPSVDSVIQFGFCGCVLPRSYTVFRFESWHRIGGNVPRFLRTYSVCIVGSPPVQFYTNALLIGSDRSATGIL